MSSYQYDVVVVGAGPSGSMTARYAAAGGCKTLLIEKRQEIGSPVRCGEGLARHFVEDTKMPFDQKWVGREVKGAKIFSPNGTELTIEEAHAGNEVGIVLERDAFDKAVAKEAAKAGAEIWLKTTATAILRDDGWVRGVHAKRLEEEMNIEAKCVVAADGYESQVGRWAGFKTLLKAGDITGTLQYRLTNIGPGHDFPDYCEFWLGTIAPAGYIWVFPPRGGAPRRGPRHRFRPADPPAGGPRLRPLYVGPLRRLRGRRRRRDRQHRGLRLVHSGRGDGVAGQRPDLFPALHDPWQRRADRDRRLLLLAHPHALQPLDRDRGRDHRGARVPRALRAFLGPVHRRVRRDRGHGLGLPRESGSVEGEGARRGPGDDVSRGR